MKRFCCEFLALVFSFVVVFGDVAEARGQIQYLQAKTSDGLLITIWIKDQPVKSGEDVLVYFKIRNLTGKTVYLVEKDRLEIEVTDEKITVNPFTIGPNEYGSTDYGFRPIKNRAIHQGRFVIPGYKLTGNIVSLVEVELAFVSSIKGLEHRPGPQDDPVAFRGLIFQRAELARIGKLELPRQFDQIFGK